jgi:Na+/H+-dicarboxylate symporter
MSRRSFILLLLSIVVGIAAGILFPQAMLTTAWVGDIFVNMLKLISLPLIFTALISAIASMGSFGELGKVAKFGVMYVFLGVGAAVFIGILIMNAFQPGVGVGASLISLEPLQTEAGVPALVAFIKGLFPASIVDAAAKFQIMPVVVFTLAFAIACARTKAVQVNTVVEFFTGLRMVFIRMIGWVIWLTPIGLFFLLSAATARSVVTNQLYESMRSLGFFVVLFLIGLFLQIVWQAVLVKLFTRCSLKTLFSAATPALMTAFGTSSSMATLPVTFGVADKLGVDKKTSQLLLPVVTTINLAGTAMYEAVAAIFFSQILGLHLSVLDQVGIFFIAIIAGMGATGIPEGGLVTMVSVLRSINIPTSAIGLLLPFDRILDRFRTLTNVWGDLACTVVVDHMVHKRRDMKHVSEDAPL